MEIQFGGIPQATVALRGTRVRSTVATLLRKFNTGGTRLLLLLLLEDGRKKHGNLQPLRFGIREHLRIDLGGSDI
jgi:hypothetical protein